MGATAAVLTTQEPERTHVGATAAVLNSNTLKYQLKHHFGNFGRNLRIVFAVFVQKTQLKNQSEHMWAEIVRPLWLLLLL